MKFTAYVLAAVVSLSLGSALHANSYGSVAPLANPAVIDTTPLSVQPLRIREASATRLFQCGITTQVIDALSKTGAITTINNLNMSILRDLFRRPQHERPDGFCLRFQGRGVGRHAAPFVSELMRACRHSD